MTVPSIRDQFLRCRQRTLALCKPLTVEDHVVQPSPEVSPPKWHLAHATWFFEELILHVRKNSAYAELFNSYYNSLGAHWPQANRGFLSRPTLKEILAYRSDIDEQMNKLLDQRDLASLIELGIHHEQQHQELLLMDIKAILAANTVETRYSTTALPESPAPQTKWLKFEEEVCLIGHDRCDASFAFDNELPRHKTYLYPFAISSSLVTNGQYLNFMNDGGYSKPEHWLSMGWDWVQKSRVTQPLMHPLYWRAHDREWNEYTLHGIRSIAPNAPVTHVNYFEADAFARWSGKRLPTEQECEIFLESQPLNSQTQHHHPTDPNAPRGEVWCWTKSSYASYPGYRPFHGALAEYNAKFMCNQFVLRGGCVATPEGHYRDTYRNFYLPEQRWMFSGIRLAEDLA